MLRIGETSLHHAAAFCSFLEINPGDHDPFGRISRFHVTTFLTLTDVKATPMPAQPDYLYVGGRGRVFALDKRTGTPMWRTELKSGWFKWGHSFVTLVEGLDRIYAFAYGTVSCLTKDRGEILWQKEIRELKSSLASLAVDAASLGGRASYSPALQQSLHDADQAAAATNSTQHANM